MSLAAPVQRSSNHKSEVQSLRVGMLVALLCSPTPLVLLDLAQEVLDSLALNAPNQSAPTDSVDVVKRL